MAGDGVTVLWVADACSVARPVVDEGDGVVLEVVNGAHLEAAIAQARSRGAVVVVGSTLSVHHLIALGADEAVLGDSGAHSMRSAIEHARTRAAFRMAEAEGVAGQERAGLVLLSAAVAHEMNNPLAAATLNCDVLEELVTPFADVIDRIAEQAQSSRDIPQSDLERLLSLAERQSGDIRGALGDLSLALRSLRDVVRQMQALMHPDAPEMCNLAAVLVDFATLVHHDVERIAELTVEVPDYPCIVTMGRARAISVLSALIQNAMTAVEECERDPTVTLRVGIDSGMVVVEVNDNGPGMRPEIRRQALNPFFTTRRPGALGLGLTFVAQHVRHAGGEILIDSEEGVGTTVRLFFRPASTLPDTRPPGNNGPTN